MKHNHSILITVFLLFMLSSCGENLGKVKGNVINVFTNMPIEGVEILATTTSDIESEQSYLRFSIKTKKDGSFIIKGLQNKKYDIQIIKEGYAGTKFSVRIPQKSTKLIKKPLKICPLPPGKGVYVYTDKYIKLLESPYTKAENRKWCIYYKAADLQTIHPIKNPKFLIYYKPSFVRYRMVMHPLYRRRTNICSTKDEGEGNYYTTSQMYYRPYRGDAFVFSGEATRPYELQIIYGFSKGIQVIDLRRIPKGYYAIGEIDKRFMQKPTYILNYH